VDGKTNRKKLKQLMEEEEKNQKRMKKQLTGCSEKGSARLKNTEKNRNKMEEE